MGYKSRDSNPFFLHNNQFKEVPKGESKADIKFRGGDCGISIFFVNFGLCKEPSSRDISVRDI